MVVFGMVLGHLRDPFQTLYSTSCLCGASITVNNQTPKGQQADPHVFVVRDGRVVRVDLEVLARQDDRVGVVVRGQTPRPARDAGDDGEDGDDGEGDDDGEDGEVSAALQLGDLVVVVGQTQLADGAAVEIATRR